MSQTQTAAGTGGRADLAGELIGAEDSNGLNILQQGPYQTPGFKGDPNGPGADGAAYYSTQVGRRQCQVLDGFRRLGRATCEQVAEAIGLHWYLTRPRASELAAKGLLVATDERGVGALGGQVTIWRPATNEEIALAAARAAAGRSASEDRR